MLTALVFFFFFFTSLACEILCIYQHFSNYSISFEPSDCCSFKAARLGKFSFDDLWPLKAAKS